MIDPAGNIHTEASTSSNAAQVHHSVQKNEELNALIRAEINNANKELKSQKTNPVLISFDASHPQTKLSIPSGLYEISSMSFLKDAGTDQHGCKKIEVISSVDCREYRIKLEESKDAEKPDFVVNIPDEILKMLSTGE